MMYVIKSGSGYYVKMDGKSPLMTTNYIEAKRCDKHEASIICHMLDTMGIDSEIVSITVARI